MPTCSEVLYNFRSYIIDSFYSFTSELWFTVLYTICYIGIMVVVMYGGLNFMLMVDYSPFGLHRIMCVHSVPIVKEKVWADSQGQLFVVFLLSYVFAGVHVLHYIIFNVVVDFLAKHSHVKKSVRQTLTPRKLVQILEDMKEKMDKKLRLSLEELTEPRQKNIELHYSIFKMKYNIESINEQWDAKRDLYLLTALIKKFLHEKSPHLFYEWSEVLEADNLKIRSERDLGR